MRFRLGTHWPWLLVLLGYISILLLVFENIEAVPLRVLLFVLSFFAIQFTAVFLHELGHLLAGIAMQDSPVTLQIGVGPLLGEFKVGPVKFRFNSTTNCGLVLSNFRLRTFKRPYFLITYAAGPLMDILGLSLVIWCLVATPESLLERENFDGQINPLLIMTSVYLFYYHLSYLTRRAAVKAGEYNDVGSLRSLWPVLGAPDHIREIFIRLSNANSGYPDEQDDEPKAPPAELGHDLQKYFEWAFEQPELTAECVDMQKDSFITTVLLCGYGAQLPAADQYSEELLSKNPESLTIQGSRGAVLIETGAFEEGKALLENVFAKSKAKIDRTISAAFLAIGEYRRGNLYSAQEWLHKAAELDVKSPAVKRAKREITGDQKRKV